VLLAVHWSRIEDMPTQTGDLSRKVVVTCGPARMQYTGAGLKGASNRAMEPISGGTPRPFGAMRVAEPFTTAGTPAAHQVRRRAVMVSTG
jgi:hypothetical protein